MTLKQIKDLSYAITMIALFCFALGTIIQIPFLLMTRYLHRPYTNEEVLLASGAVSIFLSIVSVIFYIFKTASLKNDPFRFSIILKRYFQIPVNFDLQNEMRNLDPDFKEKQLCTDGSWLIKYKIKPNIDGIKNEAQLADTKTRARERLITLTLESSSTQNSFSNATLTVKTNSFFPAIDMTNENRRALTRIINSFNWARFEVESDGNGKAKWD